VIGTFIAGIVSHFAYSWRTALIHIASLVIVLIITPQMMKIVIRHIGKKFFFQSQAITIAEETFSSIRTVRSFNREPVESRRYQAMTTAVQEEDNKANVIVNKSKGINAAIYWVTLLANMYYVGYLASHNDSGYQIGDVLAVFECQMMSNFSLVSLQMSARTENNAISGGTRILHLSKYQPLIPFDGGDIIEDFRDEIEFRNVSFKYPSRDTYVLKNVSFQVGPGEIAALVGHSGSGKSTCVQLIERFYHVTDGLILLDGRDIKTLDPRWLHQRIGLVAQDPVLFHTTVRTNIIYGTWSATNDEVIAAARTSNIAEFIETLPHKYDEMVGEKGSSLSGGQKQRIVIARAILKNPAILVTDEATSVLDAESEKKVQIALEK
jgi:ABC-type multidrug transport system fused ATPase/permease subunit